MPKAVAVRVAVVIPPGVHENVAPDVLELPVSVAVELIHVKDWVDPALTLGSTVLFVTDTVADETHEFAGLVTLRV